MVEETLAGHACTWRNVHSLTAEGDELSFLTMLTGN